MRLQNKKDLDGSKEIFVSLLHPLFVFSISFLKICFALLLVAGCTKISSGKELFGGESVYVFPGLATLDNLGDGTFKLSWEKVPAEGTTYQVYSRTSGDYKFVKSDADVLTTSWISPVVDFNTKTCFVVRYVKVGVEADSNLNEKCTTSDALVFGAKSLLSNDDGTWTLAWDQAPFTGVTYAVYSRSKTGEYNFTAPLLQLTGTAYHSSDLTFTPDTCFVVRFQVGPISFDTNTKELCLGRPAFSFKGLSALTVQTDGTYLLSWSAVPGSGQVNYYIYTTATSGSYDFSKPLATVGTTSYKSPIYPIDQNRCFVVRSSVNGQSDVNLAESCSKQSVLSDFSGVAAVTSPDTGVAQITWTASANSTVAGYRIYQGTDFGVRVGAVGAASTSTRISGLATGTSFSFGVRAFDQYGREDSNTRTMAVTISNLAPPTFAGLQTLAASGTSSAVLNWVQAGGAPSVYKIYHAAVDLNETLPTANADILAVIDWVTPYATVTSASGLTTYTATGLGDDQMHYFAMRASTSSGIEDANTVVKSVSVANSGAPTFAGVTSILNVGGKVKTTWSAPNGQTTSFLVAWTDGAAFSSSATVTAKQSGAYVTTFTTPGVLTGNTTYTFTVKAIDRYNNQDTNTASQTIALGNTTPPAQITGVIATPLDENRVRFVFATSVSTGVTGYLVKQCLGTCTSSGTFTSSTLASTVSSAGTTTVIVNGLIRQTAYTFNVTAINSNSIESQDSLVQATTLKTTAPTFGGVVSADISSTDASKFNITWSAGSSDTYVYYVFIGANTDLSSASLNTGGSLPAGVTRINVTPQATSPLNWGTPNATSGTVALASGVYSLDVASLTQAMGTTYYVRVWAADNASPLNVNQSVVMVSKMIPVNTPPGIPTYTAVWSAADGGVKIVWNNIGDAQQYTIYRALSGQAFAADTSPLQTISAGTLQWIDTMTPGVNDGSIFRYRVKSKKGTLYSTNADDSGNITIADQLAPTFSGFATAGYSGMTGFVALTWSTATDALSGLQRYRIYARGVAGVTTITAGQSYQLGTATSGATSITVGGSGAGITPSFALEVGQKYNFRVEAEDNAGNISSTAWSSDIQWGVDNTPATLTVAAIPASTILVPGGATYTLNWSVNKPGTFYVKIGATAIKTQAITQGQVNSNTYPTVSISGADLSAVSNTTGAKTLVYSFIDSGNIANGNTVSNGTITLSLVPTLYLYKMSEGTTTTGTIVLKWINSTYNAGDTLTIVKKSGATAPANTSDGSVLVSSLAQTATSYTDSTVGTIGSVTYGLFVCSSGGSCTTNTSYSAATYQTAVTGMQNWSVGGTASFSWTVSQGGGATPYIRLAISKSRSALATWDGRSTSSDITIVTSSGAETSFSSGTDASPYLNVSPWEMRYFRLSAASDITFNSVALSDIRTWARVPEGMVFVGKDDWPAAEYGETRNIAFDYAMDKYEVYETTTVLNPGGTAGSAAYPNSYNSVLKSKSGQTPKSNMDWFRYKQGCFNRTKEAEQTGFTVGANTALHPRRQIHIATDLEWFVSAYGTPDAVGAGNCNGDNRNSSAPFATGAAGTASCVSRYGAMDMIGNLDEYTDGYYSAANTRQTYFGTPFVLSETTPWVGATFVTNYDYALAVPNGWGSAATTFGSDYAGYATTAAATYRGGDFASGGTTAANTGNSGRYSMLGGWGTAANAYMGTRCALDAPAPRIATFQNDSIGNLARFYWNVKNDDVEGTVNVILAISSDKTELDNWNGETSTFTNGGTITFTTTAGAQAFSSSTISGLAACAAYTPVTATSNYTGSCSLDLSAAPFSLSRWGKRFFKLFAYNTVVNSTLGAGPSAISGTKAAGYAPPGMVFVAKEDWPIENIGNNVTWDYTTGSAANTQYDGATGPFDYAIDKYEVYETTSAANPGGTAGSAAYPNTYNSVLRSASGQTPKASIDWYRAKQGCDNRSQESDYTSFVGGTLAAVGPTRRVHMATGAEWFIGSFQTPHSSSATYCNMAVGSALATGSTGSINCISRYGSLDMIGSLEEWTDEYFANITGAAPYAISRITYYGTGGIYPVGDLISNVPASGTITAFDFAKFFATATGTAILPFYGANGAYIGTGNLATLRGGDYGAWFSTSLDGRFANSTIFAPTQAVAYTGSRCAIRSP